MPAELKDPLGLQIVDPVLSSIAVMYKPHGFIYDDLATNIDVATNSGQYPIFDRSYFFGDEIDNEVADRDPTPEIDLRFSMDRYLCKNYRFKVSVSLEERQQANSAIRLEQAKVEFLMRRMAIRREVRLAMKLRSSVNGGALTQAPATPAVKWDSGTAATPATIERDIKAADLAVYNAIGQVPNTIVLPYEVAYAIAADPTILDLLKYTVNGQEIIAAGDRILPDTLWGHKVLIAKGTQRSTAREGAPMSLTGIWGKSARLLYVDDNAGWGNPATVYSFRGLVRGEQGPEGEDAGFALVDRWTTPDPPVDNIRAWERVDEKVVAPDLGFEIQNVIN